MFRQFVGKHAKTVLVIIGQLASNHHFVCGIELARFVQTADDRFDPFLHILQVQCYFLQIAAAFRILFGKRHSSVLPFSGEKFVTCTDLPGHAVVNHLEIDGSRFPFYPRGPEFCLY